MRANEGRGEGGEHTWVWGGGRGGGGGVVTTSHAFMRIQRDRVSGGVLGPKWSYQGIRHKNPPSGGAEIRTLANPPTR